MARTKFNVDKDKEKRTCNGIVFDSILEMRYYRDVICPQVESGNIVDVQLQVKYELQPKFTHDNKTVQSINYIADFVVTYADGRLEVIDIKGLPTQDALLKRKMFWYKYPDITYIWITWCQKFGGWIEYNEYKHMKREESRNKSKLNNSERKEQ